MTNSSRLYHALRRPEHSMQVYAATRVMLYLYGRYPTAIVNRHTPALIRALGR